jgi:hypothetical protein
MDKNDKEKLRELAADLAKMLLPAISRVHDFAAMSYRTPDEEKQYQELMNLIKQAAPILGLMKDFFGNEAYRASVAWYFSVKEAAEKGDARAQEIVNELAPLYQQALFDQLDKN